MNATQTMEQTMERQIKWTASNGDERVAVIGIKLSRKINLDGHVVTTACCEWYERVESEQGVSYDIMTIAPQTVNGVALTGRCGNVGIPVEQMDVIEQVRAALQATPEWVAHEAEIERSQCDGEEYAAHTDCVDRMMGKGWTY